MMRACNLCDGVLGPPIYRSAERSITSMAELHPSPTEVFLCPQCGHVQTTPMDDVEGYYQTGYNILASSEEEDQIYAIVEGAEVFRLEHQATTFLAEISPPSGARILDYGCAKASTLKRIVERRPDLVPHVFDVSAAYQRFWDGFVPREHQATFGPPPEWNGRFDVVVSFFALEHAARPRNFVASVVDLLRVGGIFYCIVPDLEVNTADFVVVDHVNHFTESTLTRLCRAAGLTAIAVDRTKHQGALLLTAVRRESAPSPSPGAASLEAHRREILEIRDYWLRLSTEIGALEREHAGARGAAIYGGGFWGTYLASHLQNFERVRCFVDRNPHLHGTTKFGRPVVSPEHLPPEVEVVYVGLRPDQAHAAIEAIPSFRTSAIQFAYLPP